MDNSAYDLYNHTNLPIYAENNVWSNDGTSDIAAQIYDQNDEAKYGQIDFLPVLGGQATSSQLPNYMDLAQNNPLSANQIPQTNNSEQTVPADNSAGGFVENNINSDTISVAQTENFQETGTETNNIQPVVAEPVQVNPSSIRKENSALASIDKVETEPEQTLDYDQVFLEPFLDNRKAEIERKSVPAVNNALVTTKGRVIIRAIVAKNGTVESASVIKGINAYLDRITREAGLKFIFKPGTVNGVPVRFSTNIVFDF